MKPEYLRLNEVAELLKCEPHHVIDLVITNKLRCGVMGRHWEGVAFPLNGGDRWKVKSYTGHGAHGAAPETWVWRHQDSGEVFSARTARVTQFWYLRHSSAYELFLNSADGALHKFFLEPLDGVAAHNRYPECFPRPDFIFDVDPDQDPPPRITRQDILFLSRDVEELLEVDAREPAPLITAAADRTRVNSAADFNEAVYQAIVALGLDPLALPAPRPGRKGGWQAEVRRHLQAEAKKTERAWLNPSADRMRHARAALLKDRRIAELPTAD